MDSDSLQALFLDHARVFKVLDKSEAEVCAQLCELAKATLQARAKIFVSDAQGGALLLSYQSDSTPLLTKGTFVARHASGQAVVRKAGSALELLLERVFSEEDCTDWRGFGHNFLSGPSAFGQWQRLMAVLLSSLQPLPNAEEVGTPGHFHQPLLI